ncbi:hypothetical protein [Azospirillum palustre]|uniref:hypothetical protein n=1 Tax=Azospirillum palustre TaxID=2044885 RepID=UPI00137AAAEA|nr:hypothetical protein [Azospirillum palustre]
MDAPKAAKKLAAMGQGDDSVLLHVQPDQVPAIAKALGHPGTVNPNTGLLGFWERGGDSPGGGGGAGDGGGGESEGGGPGGGFGGGWNRSSTGLSDADLSALGLGGYSFGGFGRSTQDFTPNSLGFGVFGMTPGTVASPDGLLAGAYTREAALGWSPSKAALDALGTITGLPAGLVATLAGYRPDDFQVVGSLGNMGFTNGTSADAGGMAGAGASGGGPGGGAGGYGGADRGANAMSFAANATAPAAAAPASPGRQYQAYTGDPYTYGQGGEHRFFTNNSLSAYRPTAAAPAPTAAPAGAATQGVTPQQLQQLLALLSSGGTGYGR